MIQEASAGSQLGTALRKGPSEGTPLGICLSFPLSNVVMVPLFKVTGKGVWPAPGSLAISFRKGFPKYIKQVEFVADKDLAVRKSPSS